MLLPLEGQN
ncbi:hypothetical protein ACMD2_06393 [Ananas comosus]|uniref:Uncharacterized protein n=1 Tax=Ananas comosus TaxID=4615 RepID=A0A199VDV3_ANACO|nr:hypothetical protein ACMD2_06393 [Ananas comosus]